jgi:hypothetical protein
MTETKITLLDRIRALFAKDKEEFWFKHFTDEEKELKRMDVWQLAKTISESRINNMVGAEEKCIVAEHMLNVRLAKIQAMPNYILIISGILCVFIGSYLNSFVNKPQNCVCECPAKCASQNQVNNLIPPLSTPPSALRVRS